MNVSDDRSTVAGDIAVSHQSVIQMIDTAVPGRPMS